VTNFAVPFGLTPSGQVRVTSDPNQIANEHVTALIGTFPGERVMLPDYGVNFPSYLFAPDIVAQSDIISLSVTQAVNQWEPTIILDSVTPDATFSDVGIVSIGVKFSLSNNPSLTPPQIATVEVGGRVVNG